MPIMLYRIKSIQQQIIIELSSYNLMFIFAYNVNINIDICASITVLLFFVLKVTHQFHLRFGILHYIATLSSLTQCMYLLLYLIKAVGGNDSGKRESECSELVIF